MTACEIENLPPLRDVIREHGLAAKKSLGQNFLLDLNLTRKIARAANLSPEMTVIEIGPGPGGLTRALLEQEIKTLYAIERDDRCIQALQPVIQASQGRLVVHAQDALQIDVVDHTDEPRAIVANLPYNIATVLLINWLKSATAFQSMTLMFQKEVAQRIVAPVGTKAYGRLSVISQWLCACKIAFDVPASAFTPPPKVTSSIVHMRPYTGQTATPKLSTVEKITAMAFNQRRKMIRQSLKSLVPDIRGFLNQVDMDETHRADHLSVEDYLTLACHYEDNY